MMSSEERSWAVTSISVLAYSGDTTGAADTAAINSALSSVGSGGSSCRYR
jgi:hypothetical protein